MNGGIYVYALTNVNIPSSITPHRMHRLFLPLLFISCMSTKKNETIHYLPLGDSYTICEGAQEKDSWPQLLTQHLGDSGLVVKLIGNPARTGYTTEDLMREEYPRLDNNEVDFVTLCIGVNDWVQGADSAAFHNNLTAIIDRIQSKLKDKRRLVLITIPDFGVTPTGKLYGNGRDIGAGIASFNDIIFSEARVRNLKTVDLFSISKAMGSDPTLIAGDGLHPSAKEYAIWEKAILPAAMKVLKM